MHCFETIPLPYEWDVRIVLTSVKVSRNLYGSKYGWVLKGLSPFVSNEPLT
jgi:hypothetical protein